MELIIIAAIAILLCEKDTFMRLSHTLPDGKLHMLHEAAALHGCFQQHIVIGTDNFLSVGKSYSLMSCLCAEAFLLQLVQHHAVIPKAIAYDD